MMKKARFQYQKLHVYRAAIEFVEVADLIVKELPKGRAYVADQLQRAAASIVLNIGEGAGEYRPKDKARFYRFALRSATECAGLIDICRQLSLCSEELIERSDGLLERIVAMLTKLVIRLSPTESKDGTGSGGGNGSGSESGRSGISFRPPRRTPSLPLDCLRCPRI